MIGTMTECHRPQTKQIFQVREEPSVHLPNSDP